VQYRFPTHLSHCVGFDWDAGNRDKNELAHQVTTEEAEQVFSNRPILRGAAKQNRGESRMAVIGQTDAGRVLTVVFTVRGNRVRVISARDVSRKQRRLYGQAE
jgi:uncharacterized protein